MAISRSPKRNHRAEALPVEYEIPMRVVVLNPPPGVAVALRTQKHELVGRTITTDADLFFDFTIRGRQGNTNESPRLLGPFAVGPPAKRYAVLVWGTLAGQPTSCWTRGTKIVFSGITWTLIEQAKKSGGSLEVRYDGLSKRGVGPACATVPLLDGGWRVNH